MEATYLLGALGSALVSLYAAILTIFFTSTQMAIDPATHEEVYVLWWTMFRSGEIVLVLGFLFATVGFGWLAWYLCRRAYLSSTWT